MRGSNDTCLNRDPAI